MYEINLDKNEQFKCKINLQGSNLKSTNVRLRIQPDNNPIGLVFEGVINTETGFCNIDIGKLKKYIDEDITGKIILEVVVDNDTYFEPGTDVFSTQYSKKLQVEVIDRSSTFNKKVDVTVIRENDHISEFKDLLKEKNIDIPYIKKHMVEFKNIINRFYTQHDIKSNKREFLKEVLSRIKK